jgi:hypothetical protein
VLWLAGRTWPVAVSWTFYIEPGGALREVVTYGPRPLIDAAQHAAIPLAACCVTTLWTTRRLGHRFAVPLRWVSLGAGAGAAAGLALGGYVLVLAASLDTPATQWLPLDLLGSADAAARPLSYVLGAMLWQLGDRGFVVVGPALNGAFLGAVIGLVATLTERRYRVAAA